MKKMNSKQNLLILLCWAIYTAAYLGRYSYNSNINLIMSDYGVTHASAGLVTTFFFFGYGVGQLVHGLLCEKYRHRLLFPLILFASAVINLVLCFDIPFFVIKYLWLLNAALQSALWPTVIQTVSRYLDADHRKRAIVVLSTTTPVGTFLTYLASTIFVKLNHYRMAFLFGACVMGVIALLWLVLSRRVSDLPLVNAPQTEDAEAVRPKEKHRLAPAMLGTVCVLCVVAVVHNFIKDGLNTWVPSILKESNGLGDSMSIFLSLALPLLGVFGAVLAVTLQKKIRDLIWLSVTFLGASVPLIFLVIRELRLSVVLSLSVFAVVVLMMHAVNSVVTSMAPLMLNESGKSGRLAGIMNACCYLGSTCSSYLLGLVADASGWTAVMYLFLAAAMFAVLLGSAFRLFVRLRHRAA